MHYALCIMHYASCIELRKLNRFSGVIYGLGKEFIRNFVVKLQISFPY